jgi:hypothetical protein
VTRRSRLSVGILLAFGVILALFGVSDMLAGPTSDPAITVAVAGLSPEEVRAAEPTGFRLFDYAVRAGGLNLLFLGLLLTAIVAGPYRAGSRWAWTTLLLVPAWSVAVPVMFVAFGPAPGMALPPPAISGSIFALVTAAALFADRRRFGVGRVSDPLLGVEPA